jgi:hypothetical protein
VETSLVSDGICQCGCGQPTDRARLTRRDRGYVRGQFLRYRKAHRPSGAMDEVARRERFWSRVRKTDTCWYWTGHRDHHGYGRMRIAGRQYGTHRLSWQWATGRDPGPLCVMHACDTPTCVRPEHLRLGTMADNQGDSARKGRMARGERHPASKLNETAVQRIRLQAAIISHSTLARQLGVSRRAVRAILQGRTWAWLRIGGLDNPA